MNAFLKPIIIAIKDAVDDFGHDLANNENFNSLLLSRGWVAYVNSSTQMPMVESALNLTTDIDNIIAIVRKIENSNEPIETLVSTALPVIQSFYNHIAALAVVSASSYTFFPLNQSDFWTELADNLFDDILIRYLESKQKTIFSILHFTGVIDITEVTPPAAGRITYFKKKIYWNKLGDLISQPLDLIKNRYSWGVSTTNYNKLYSTLTRIFNAFSLPPARTLIKESHFNQFYPPTFDASLNVIEELEIPIYENVDLTKNNYRKFGVSLLPAPATTSSVSGLFIIPKVEGVSNFSYKFSPELALKGTGFFSSNNILAYKVTPASESIVASVASATIGAKINLIAAPMNPWVLFGNPNSTRLMLNGVETSIEIRGSVTDPEIIFKLGTGDTVTHSNIIFVFEPKEGDGFIKKLLGDKSWRAFADLGFQWSSKRGISFQGSGVFEVDFPIHHEKQPGGGNTLLQVTNVKIAAGVISNKFSLSIGVNILFATGPVVATIENVGLTASLIHTPISSTGILKNLDYKLGFLPPKGVGLSIDAGTFKGGGYLSFDPDRGLYKGAVKLEVVDMFALTGVGVITTKDPDGNPGYSMLALLSVRFNPGFTLGFGFTLKGVGALLGVNRDMNPDAILEGVQTQSLGPILFGDTNNFIQNADSIIKGLETFFPQKQDRQVFGLLGTVEWGTPTRPQININLAIVINMPKPWRVAIIGTLKAGFPDLNNPVAKINADFAGIADFDQKYMMFDAHIYNSEILFMKLTGDVCLRIFWGDRKDFLLSAGGFHPSYQVPAFMKVPKMARLSMSMQSDILSLGVDAYVAITSNTVQFGIHAYVDFKLVIRIKGELGLDTIFQFNPFRFVADAHGLVELSVAGWTVLGVSLLLHLDGPGPWNANGAISYTICGIKDTQYISKTWGATAPATIAPSVTLASIIEPALAEDRNWRSELPKRFQLKVAMKELPAGVNVILPNGNIVISQTIAPLGITLQYYGQQSISGAALYDISAVAIVSPTGTVLTPLPVDKPVKEDFAPAQYLKMKDEDKLKAPSFESLKSGVRCSVTEDAAWSGAIPPVVVRTMKYDKITIDSQLRIRPTTHTALDQLLAANFIKGGALSANPVVTKSAQLNRRPVAFATHKQERYNVRTVNQLAAVSGASLPFNSRAEARSYLNSQNELDAAGMLLVPNY